MSHEELELEYRLVLAELDAIHRALRVPDEPGAAFSGSGSAAVAPSPKPAETRLPTGDARGAPSPYLDDRLATARDVAADLSNEFEEIQQRTQGLGTSVATLREELDRATEELAFLRAGPGLDPEPNSPPPANALPPPKGKAAAAAAPTRPVPASAPPAFGDFTVARYNETMQEVRERRPRLFATTLLLAAAISAVLVTLTVYAHEAMPVWWLAGLPLVWMIPVPFFLVSFVGTHRILSSTPLELPEAA
jgi:hypothetical protein